MKNVFIIGSKGYTKNYGGWETFVHGLLDNWKDKTINFFVFEISHDIAEKGKIEVINGFTCITLFVASTGNSSMVKYDYEATKYAYKYVHNNKIENPIFFYLGLRIGPYIWLKKRRFKKAGIILVENPAGIEWKRTKWNKLVQLYAYLAAKMMASSVDYLICDNGGVLDIYSKFNCCKNTKKLVIAYGTYPRKEMEQTLPEKVAEYYKKFSMKPNHYYLILGRLVPENNYDLMLSEICKYSGNNRFLIICNTDKERKYFAKLEKKYHITDYDHIVFAGELYDQEMLAYIRQNALAYIHGHSVGGTNPGLLEAMSNTDVNILFDCPFNKEVGKDCAYYFNRSSNSLLNTIRIVDRMDSSTKKKFGELSKLNMSVNYSWNGICQSYSEFFNKIV